MVENTFLLSWGKNEKMIISSISQLNGQIDLLLSGISKSILPIAIELSKNGEMSLLITIGAEQSHVEFFDKNGSPLVVGCLGPVDSSELIEYSFFDEPTEMEIRYCVPISSALEAIREFFLLGRRPTNIKWGAGGIPIP